MKLKRLQQVLEDETIKIAYNTSGKEEVVLAVGIKPRELVMENVDEQSIIKELSKMLKKVLTKDDVEDFFLVFNLIPGVAKDSGDSNENAQVLRKWLESFGSKNFVDAFNDIIKVFREIVKLNEEKTEKDLFSLVISPTVVDLMFIRIDANELRRKVLLPALTGAKRISADDLIKISGELASEMRTIKEELEKANKNLSKRLFEYIENVAKIAFIIETAGEIIPPGLLSPSDWEGILKDAAELRRVIKVVKNKLENIKHPYEKEGRRYIVSDILDAFDLPRLTGGENDVSKWIRKWLDLNESEKDSYGDILSRLRASVFHRIWMGESEEDDDDQIVKVPAAKDFKEVFIELYSIYDEIVKRVLEKVETYSEEEQEKIVNSQDFKDFAETANNINLLLGVLKEKFEVIAGSKGEVYPILTNLTEKARQVLYKILAARNELLYHMRKLDYHFFAETNYNLAEPYEALLQFLSDLAREYSVVYEKFRHASKSRLTYFFSKQILEILKEAVEIYKQAFHNYIAYLIYQELASSKPQKRDIYNKFCVTDVKTVIGNPGDAEKKYIDEVLKRTSRTFDECSVTLYVFLKEMEDLIERESGKDLEILPFSIQHVRDVLYQKVEDNLAAIAAIVRGIGGAAVS